MIQHNFYSFNLTKYLEKHNFSINEGDTAREVFNFVTRFLSPVEGNEGESVIKSTLTVGPPDLNSLSGAVEHSLTLDPDVLWPDLPEDPDPEEPGGGEEDPEEPGDGDEDPEEPGDGEEDPEEPGDGEEDPEEPGDGEEDPEEPGDGEEDPEEPGDGEEDPEEPGDGEEDPEEPGDGEEDPEEPGDGDEDPEEPGDEDEDPEAGEPGDGEEEPEAPVYINRSLIEFTTEYDLFYSEQLGWGDLTISQLGSEQVGLDFEQIDELTYTLQLPKELGHILESDTFKEAGFFGAFNVPLVDENGDYVFYEIEDLESFNQYVTTDLDTNSIHVEISKWADSLGYEITDEEYLYSQALSLSYDLEGVEGVHTIATAYTDGKLDLRTLDNQANLIEVDFDSGTDLPDIEPVPEPQPEPEPQPDDGDKDPDNDKVTPPGKNDGDKKDGDKKDGTKKDHKDGNKDKKDKYKKDKSKDKDKEEGGVLPKTATNDLAYALTGLAALLVGLAARFSSRFRKA
ncbi:hypothetical protein [Alkalicoccobacillus plakortidis]|uniref:Gram-positive cocci surface proteins LPxTG domain-containing protein n=1 Tax=Alkalicoccobacillus plakortidis TaxID=444060 RepID=A0ABT0XPZ2_9BACI|nr:hypothetical protein [Alkalicoccobacillus plakortidis]MCM2677309.1 hypothetical protein [Alkalicoccobacillus plakortidis]